MFVSTIRHNGKDCLFSHDAASTKVKTFEHAHCHSEGLKARTSNLTSAEAAFFARRGLKTFFKWFRTGLLFLGSSTTVPAVLEVALPGYQQGSFQLERITNSGAGGNQTSLKALRHQKIPPDVGLQASQVKQPIQLALVEYPRRRSRRSRLRCRRSSLEHRLAYHVSQTILPVTPVPVLSLACAARRSEMFGTIL